MTPLHSWLLVITTSITTIAASVWFTRRTILRPQKLVPRETFDTWTPVRQRMYLRHPRRGQRCACRSWCTAYGPVIGDEHGEPWEHRPERCCPLRELIP